MTVRRPHRPSPGSRLPGRCFRSAAGLPLGPLLGLLVVAGCVERRLVLESDPPGALVFHNGQEVARTPAEVPFTWYGEHDFELRKSGYETLDTSRWVVAPWWQWVPLDLVAELLPVRLTHAPRLTFRLEPAKGGDAGLIERAEAMRAAVVDEPATRPSD